MTPKKNGSNLKRFWIPLFIFVVAVICFYKVVDHLPDVFAGILEFIGILSPFIGGLVIAFILYKPAFALESMLLKTKKAFPSGKAFFILQCIAQRTHPIYSTTHPASPS